MNLTQDQAFALLAARLDHAREKHPVFATDLVGALRVILAEFEELCEAVATEGPARITDEGFDLAATAMRLVMGEVNGGRE